MAAVPNVFKDAGLTEPFDDATDTLGAVAVNGSSDTGVFYVGNADSAVMLQASSDPGVDSIVVSIVDASPGGGVEAAHIKLAISSGGLSSATAGASLNIGETILGGVGNAVSVHYQWDNSVGSGTYTEISLGIVALAEVAV